VSAGEPVKAERVTPEEEARLREQPIRTVRAKVHGPVPAAEAQRAKVRSFMLGAAVAAGASVAAAVGFLLIRHRSQAKPLRKPQRKPPRRAPRNA